MKLLLLIISQMFALHVFSQKHLYSTSATSVYRLDEKRVVLVPSFGFSWKMSDKQHSKSFAGLGLDISNRTYSNTLKNKLYITEIPVYLSFTKISGSSQLKGYFNSQIGLNLVNRSFQYKESSSVVNGTYKSLFSISLAWGAMYSISNRLGIQASLRLSGGSFKAERTGGYGYNKSVGVIGNTGVNIGIIYN